MKKIIFTTILMLGLLSNLQADSFNDGLKAYNAKDFKKAETLFSKFCDAGNASGCYNLGLMYDNGKGVKQNDFKAVKLYTKACNSGYINGCYNLGLMYFNGNGVRQSDSRAKELFGKACDGGDAFGCKNYAILNKR